MSNHPPPRRQQLCLLRLCGFAVTFWFKSPLHPCAHQGFIEVWNATYSYDTADRSSPLFQTPRDFPTFLFFFAYIVRHEILTRCWSCLVSVQTLHKVKWSHRNGTACIIISPTRELSLQTYGVLRDFVEAGNMKQTHGLLIGGANRRGII